MAFLLAMLANSPPSFADIAKPDASLQSASDRTSSFSDFNVGNIKLGMSVSEVLPILQAVADKAPQPMGLLRPVQHIYKLTVDCATGSSAIPRQKCIGGLSATNAEVNLKAFFVGTNGDLHDPHVTDIQLLQTIRKERADDTSIPATFFAAAVEKYGKPTHVQMGANHEGSAVWCVDGTSAPTCGGAFQLGSIQPRTGAPLETNNFTPLDTRIKKMLTLTITESHSTSFARGDETQYRINVRLADLTNRWADPTPQTMHSPGF